MTTRWTKTPPTAPGWYWCRWLGGKPFTWDLTDGPTVIGNHEFEWWPMPLIPPSEPDADE